MPRTHFTVVSQKRDGRTLEFVADYRQDSPTGTIVGRQTFKCPVAGTRTEQERLMANEVRSEVRSEDAAVAAPLLVPLNTTIAIDAPAATARETAVNLFVNRYERRKQIMIAVNAGLMASNDTRVTNQLTQTVAAFDALPGAGLTVAEILDLL